MARPVIDIRGIHRIFESDAGFAHVLHNITFSVQPGEFVAITGPSGSGKSTLMNILGCLDTQSSGVCRIGGVDIGTLDSDELAELRGKRIGFIFQRYNLLSTLSATENVALPAVYSGVDKKARLDRAKSLLADLGLPDKLENKPNELSGGQQQRVGIARALAVKPEFIVCDEPISALDVSIQSQVVNMLEDMQQELGLTYLFIAHDLSVVRHISNRIGVMYLGSLVELAESYELNKNPLHPYTKTLLSAVPVPDPEVSRQRQRIVLEGDIPSPMHPPKGCRFHTRCPYATDKCKEAVPEFKEHAPGHWAACHLLG
mgnify:CR=1 FL=1